MLLVAYRGQASGSMHKDHALF